jgi:hypothetical protein
MKKLITMIALAAVSFGSVYAHATVKSTMQTDTTKKSTKKDTTTKKTPPVMKLK